MEKGGVGTKTEQKNSPKTIHFADVNLTPETNFPFDLHVRKRPIEIRDGDNLGANSVEVKFQGETLALMKEAEKLRDLPEKERILALVHLVRTKLKYPYPEVIEGAEKTRPDLKEWFETRFGPRPSIAGLELNDFLRNGYGDCKIMAAAYLVAAQAAGLKGIYANSTNNSLRNILRPDTGKPIFRSVEVDRDVNSAHAWVEIELADGSWIPVDATIDMVGSAEMMQVFKEAGYKVPVAFKSKLPQELDLKRGDDCFEPGESEIKLSVSLIIRKEISFITRTQKPVAGKFSAKVDLVLSSAEDRKSMNLDFKE